MSSSIPIENLYYLFCYAWDRFPEGQAVGVGAVSSPTIWDLLASVLVRGVNRLMRRGLDRDYTEHEDETRTVRGRIVIAETGWRMAARRAQAFCRYDELQYDVLHNQIIKATLRSLATNPDVAPTIRHDIVEALRSLPAITDVRLSRTVFSGLQLSRNNGHYDLLLKICDLIHAALLPHESGARTRFSAILENEERMAELFELFIRNFFRSEQKQFTVGRDRIHWDANVPDPLHEQFLPTMNTDVTLRSLDRCVVLDAKYYRKTLSSSRFGQDKIRSDHLYQLYAYLTNLQRDSDVRVEGILVYPTVDRPLDLRYEIAGHSVRVATIDLNQPWQDIHRGLLKLIDA